MQLRWKKVRHHLNNPFRIAHGSFEYRDAYIIEIREGSLTGYGETTVIPYYIKDEGQIISAFRSMGDLIARLSLSDPRNIWGLLQKYSNESKFALSAVDCALWDLYGKSVEKRVVDLLFPDKDLSDLPETSLTIGGGPIDEMQKRIKESPWPAYKVKIGMKKDLEILKALRAVTHSNFRVDANAGLSIQEAVALAGSLKELGVEILEQPLSPKANRKMIKLKAMKGPVLMADESCHSPEDVAVCAEYFDGVNIKLLKAGGITPALQMIEEAKRHGLSVMVGCMTESSVGISAGASLLPAMDYADLDGALLLKEDLAKGVEIERGKVYLPDQHGLGITLHEGVF